MNIAETLDELKRKAGKAPELKSLILADQKGSRSAFRILCALPGTGIPGL